MRVLPTSLASQAKLLNEKLQRYGRSRWWGIFSRRYEDIVQAWTENDVARLKAEVLNFDNQFLIVRVFARFFSYVEHKRALLCYYEAKKLMNSLESLQETSDLASWATATDVPLVWSSHNQVQRLSGYSRLSVVAKSLLQFIQELTNHFAPATPQVALVVTNVGSHFADDPTPSVVPTNTAQAASSVDAFERDLAIFNTLCKQTRVSEAEVKKAYLKLAVSYHPDKDRANPNSSENMQRLVKCYGEFKLSREPQVHKKSLEQMIVELNQQMDAGIAELKAEIAALRAELKAETAALRAETTVLCEDLCKEMSGMMRADLSAKLSAVRSEFSGEIANLYRLFNEHHGSPAQSGALPLPSKLAVDEEVAASVSRV